MSCRMAKSLIADSAIVDNSTQGKFIAADRRGERRYTEIGKGFKSSYHIGFCGQEMFDFLIPPDFVGGLKDETRSAESATDIRESIGFDPSPERAGETSFALSGLASAL
jgi:hypothetical protein